MAGIGWLLMAMIVVSTDLPHPPDGVWSELAQLERHSDWMADAERIDFDGEQRSGVGTRMAVRTRVGPLVTTDVIEVRSWLEGQSIGVSHRGIVTGLGVFVLVPIDGGTRFVWWEDLEFPWYLGGPITAWFARPVLRLIWQGNLKRFARTLEPSS
jgi:hypothetical protein